MIILALLCGSGLLDAERTGQADLRSYLVYVRPGPLPEYRFDGVPRLDVLVALISGIQSGELACDLERRGELAHAEYRSDPVTSDLLELRRVEINDMLFLVDLHQIPASVEYHDYGYAVILKNR